MIGLCGGTFDPVHRGHVHAARTACLALGLPLVRMVLSARPGHRSVPDTTIEQRWEMLCLACARYPELVADDIESRRRGKSYTLRTVQDLHAQGYIPCWIIGEDSFATISQWYGWEEIINHCNLVIVDRPGSELPLPAIVTAYERQTLVETLDLTRCGQLWRLTDLHDHGSGDVRMMDVSASEIRRKIALKADVSNLLEESVWTYIKQHNLYKGTSI